MPRDYDETYHKEKTRSPQVFPFTIHTREAQSADRRAKEGYKMAL